MLKRLFTSLLLVSVLLVATESRAVSTGPGGIGDTSGTSELRLWLQADVGVQKDDGMGGFTAADHTDQVRRWLDSSGYGVHGLQNTVANRPSFQTGEVNNLPVVRFDGSAAVLHYLLLPHFMDFSEPTIYMVGYRHDGSGVGSVFAVGGHSSPNSLQLRYHNSTDRFWFSAIDADGTILGTVVNNTTDNIPHVGMVRIDDGNMLITHNGTVRHNETNANYTPVNFNTGVVPRIGWNSGSDSYRLNGDLGEIIVFERPLTSIEHVMVNNALSAKWGIAGLNASVDKYAGDDAFRGDYDSDVFGIGNDGTSSLLSGEKAGLKLTAGSLSPGQYLLAGHKTTENGLVETGELVAWDREFYLDVSGAFEATLTFDFAEGDIAFSEYFHTLLFKENEGDAWTRLDAIALFGANQVSFTLSAAQLFSGYYTIGAAVPEPGSLTLAGFGLLLFVRRKRDRLVNC